MAIIFLTYVSRPILNLLILSHPLGRIVLTPEEQTEALLICGLLASTVLTMFFAPIPWPIYAGFAFVIVTLMSRSQAPIDQKRIVAGIGYAAIVAELVLIFVTRR